MKLAGRLDVTALLPDERSALLDLLGGLSADEWAAPTECPAWSVKGIALHVLGDDLSLLSRQRDEAVQDLVLYAADHGGLDFRGLLDGFNEQCVTAATFLSESLVVELLRLSGEWTAAYYSSVDLDSLGEPVEFFGTGGPAPYWQISAREYVERWVHQHQIRRAAGRADLGVDFLAPAAQAAVRGIAGNLRLDVPPGTVVSLAIDGVDRWTLAREDDRWAAYEGGDVGTADAGVVIDPAVATTLLSRGLTGAAASAALTVAGDTALANRFVTAIAAMVGRDRIRPTTRLAQEPRHEGVLEARALVRLP